MARKLNNNGTRQDQARLFVVDNYPMVRERLKQVVYEDAALVLCGETDNADHALQNIETARPDLVVTDLGLRDSSGLELIVRLRAKHRNIKVLVLSACCEPCYAEQALRAGAQGYVAKQESTSNVLLAIHHVLAGKLYLTDRILRQFAPGMLARPPAADNSVPALLRGLSARELRVFDLVGQGYGTRVIAAKLRVDPPTVRTFRARIRKKMRMNGSDELAHAAVKWQQAQAQDFSAG
jgi:DNA-binding NarL/FixJ family response regulator